MNRVPDEFIRVFTVSLLRFTEQVGCAVGLSQERAGELARLLTDNDCRGVFSHGTSGLLSYAKLLRDGQVNPDPQVTIVSETPTSALVDGDGGLGYFNQRQFAELAPSLVLRCFAMGQVWQSWVAC